MGGVQTRRDQAKGIATTSDPNDIMSNLANDLKDIKTKKKLKRKSMQFAIEQKMLEQKAGRTILKAFRKKQAQEKAR